MAIMTDHTIKAFDADLQELSRMIAEMGGLAESMIAESVDALNRLDTVLSQSIITQAQATPEGRARIALAAALYDLPQGFGLDPFSVLQQELFPFWFGFRAELEARARGNPSWNTGVDYEEQLKRSVGYAEVKALYEQFRATP